MSDKTTATAARKEYRYVGIAMMGAGALLMIAGIVTMVTGSTLFGMSFFTSGIALLGSGTVFMSLAAKPAKDAKDAASDEAS